jgi:hypothetical protein
MDFALRSTSYPWASPLQLNVSSLPPALVTRKYAVEKTSLIVGVNVTVNVDVAPGIRSALMCESYKLLSFPSSDTLSILN